mgnify:FL=1
MRARLPLLLSAYTVSGSLGYFFAKYALEYSSPILLIALRYAIAGGVLAALGGRIILQRDVAILAALTASSSVLWALGLEYVSPASSSVLSYTMPFFSVPLAYLILGERSTRWEILGMVLGFLGVSIYSVPLMHGLRLLGALLTIANAFFWASYTVYYRKLRSMNALSVNTTQLLLGSLMLLPLSWIGFHLEPTVDFLLYLLGLAIPSGAFTFFLWNLVLKEESVGRASALAFSVPIFSVALQSAMDMSAPPAIELVGMAVMLTGIALSRRGIRDDRAVDSRR